MRPLLGRPLALRILHALPHTRPVRTADRARVGERMDQLVLVTIYSPVTQLTITMFLAV